MVEDGALLRLRVAGQNVLRGHGPLGFYRGASVELMRACVISLKLEISESQYHVAGDVWCG